MKPPADRIFLYDDAPRHLFPYSSRSASASSASVHPPSQTLKLLPLPTRKLNRPFRSQTLSSTSTSTSPQSANSSPSRPLSTKLNAASASASITNKDQSTALPHRSFSKSSGSDLLQWQLKSVGSITGGDDENDDSDLLARAAKTNRRPSLPVHSSSTTRSASVAPQLRSTSDNANLPALSPSDDDDADSDSDDLAASKPRRPASSSANILDFRRSSNSRPLPRATVSQQTELRKRELPSPLGMLSDMRSASEGKIETRSEGSGRVQPSLPEIDKGSSTTSSKRRGFFKALW
jgi:hypothetical protein